MDHAPHFDHPDQFDHKRIRLADIDGTGTTDIIYLHGDGVRLYFNQSGNSWSNPRILSVFPDVDDLVSIMPADLLGNGTARLVWSSPLPGEAYFVKCDSETTTQNDINLGVVNIHAGFAPLKPAEFVILKIQQKAGQHTA